jgi:hypothetical protein
MKILSVYDPALRCSTGVCGPQVDESLFRFAADVEWLKGRGVTVRRFNLAMEPGAFAADPVVAGALMREGVGCLPLLLMEGEVVATGAYPGRVELSRLALGMEEPARLASRSLPIAPLAGGYRAPDSGCC